MPFDGSGNFQRVMNWTNDAAAGVKIKADRHDTEDNNFASGLSNTITKDGQTQPTANIPLNGKKLVNVGNPTDPQDVATKGYADAIRDFATAIRLTGAPPQARIAFTQQDLALMARAGGGGGSVPPDSLNRLVVNDKADGTGTDVISLDETGWVTAAYLRAKGTLPELQFWDANRVRGQLYFNFANNTLMSGAFDAAGAFYTGGAIYHAGNCPGSTAGYQRLATGMTINWGIALSPAAGDIFVAFPASFTGGTYGLAVICELGTGVPQGWFYGAHAASLSPSSFYLQARSVSSGGVVSGASIYMRWIAIGY